MPAIPRKLPSNYADWNANVPRMHMVHYHLQRIVDSAPDGWRDAIRVRFPTAEPVSPFIDGTVEHAKWFVEQQPEWVRAWDKLQELADFDDAYGDASRLNLSDFEICAWAKQLAAQMDELMDGCELAGFDLADRGHALAMALKTTGALQAQDVEDLFKVPLYASLELRKQKTLAAIKRASDDAWWRRKLRRTVARVVEAGAIRLGLVNVAKGRYVSNGGLVRRQAQIKRNAEALARSLYRNETGQVYTLAELAALGTANPLIRGGELMTRIRGAEEYADAHGHVGMFITLTLPSKYHPVTIRNGKTRHNKKYNGATPRDGQRWLCDTWAKVRAKLGRKGVKIYGLRVAEPHHDGTPHWHAMLWAESQWEAQLINATLRQYWLAEDGNERGAQENRICTKRIDGGGAAGYVAKYIAKSVGHIALAEHQDLVDGQQIDMDFGPEESQGHQRVDAWAATWGIRQFQTIGMPSVTAWRELRRVSGDQLELFANEGDRATLRAYRACHRSGDVKADWRVFMEAMGGHALKRDDWHLRTVNRMAVDGQCNKYGEAVKKGRIVGLVPQHGRMSGRWLVSRRIVWAPVAGDTSTHATHATNDSDAENGDAAVQAQGTGAAQDRAPQAAAWTGFNNCTARITGELANAVFGVAERDKTPNYPQATLDHFQALRQQQENDRAQHAAQHKHAAMQRAQAAVQRAAAEAQHAKETAKQEAQAAQRTSAHMLRALQSVRRAMEATQ
ncbi:replication endonuclease [Comamonas sp. J-3]|uniref:replication endonuclease n=1 Tax=Comamonas trifloxystrobinivorans TaxID=3350256 RepID=UPI0037296B6F